MYTNPDQFGEIMALMLIGFEYDSFLVGKDHTFNYNTNGDQLGKSERRSGTVIYMLPFWFALPLYYLQFSI